MIRRRVVAHPGARSDRSQPRRTRCPPPARKMDTCPVRLATSPRLAVKSNGFKHGGGARKDGEPKHGAAAREGQGARDVAARARLKEVLLRRAKEVAEGGSSAGKAETRRRRDDRRRRAGRARDGGGGARPSRPTRTFPSRRPLRRPTRPSPPTRSRHLSRMGDTPASRAALRHESQLRRALRREEAQVREAARARQGDARRNQGGRANRRRRRVSDEDENVL